jgi:hypothetical protein
MEHIIGALDFMGRYWCFKDNASGYTPLHSTQLDFDAKLAH